MCFKCTVKVFGQNLKSKWCNFDDFSNFSKLISLFHTFHYPKGQIAITLISIVRFQKSTHYYKWEFTLIIYQELNFDHVHRGVSFWQNGSQLWKLYIQALTKKSYTIRKSYFWKRFQDKLNFVFFILVEIKVEASK